MTNLITPESPQQALEGRSVRDVVAHNPEQVDDAWCRKILRKILQSLELQYAMQMPHRAITLDTVVFHANGEPFLISDDIDADPAPDAQQADDLTALASVIHYAITQEPESIGPLAGRVDGYSAALVATVDACMDLDPARRPRNIDAVRGLLETVAPAPRERDLDAAVVTGASVAAVTTAPLEAVGDPHPHGAGMRRSQRWAIAAGGGAIAIALALVLFPAWRGAGLSEHRVVTSPPTSSGVQPALRAPADPANNPADSPASGASSGGTTSSGGGVDQPEKLALVAPAPARVAPAPAPASVAEKPPRTVAARAAIPPKAVAGTASYQLQIKPWGDVNVDGVDRGVSPPLKRLTLTPGHHTVRISNPKYRDSILEFDSAQTTSNGKIIVDFDREAP